jgi:outer membrane usher protein
VSEPRGRRRARAAVALVLVAVIIIILLLLRNCRGHHGPRETESGSESDAAPPPRHETSAALQPDAGPERGERGEPSVIEAPDVVPVDEEGLAAQHERRLRHQARQRPGPGPGQGQGQEGNPSSQPSPDDHGAPGDDASLAQGGPATRPAADRTAAPPDATTSVRALLTLIIDDVPHGEILVYLGDGHVLVRPDDLEAAGIAGTDEAPTVLRDGTVLIDLDALVPGVTYKVDPEGLALRLTVAPRLLAKTVVDLRRRALPAEVRPATSAFVNYAAHTNFSSVYGYGEAGVSAHGALLYSSGQVTPDGRSVRGLSNLTLDDRKGMRRLVAGDAFSGTGALGGSVFVGGLTLSRNFDLDPYFVHAPSLAREGAVLSPTTAEIYVNGTLVRQVQLPPGSFRLDNVPGTTGAGDVRIVLRDAFGRRQDITTSFYLPAGLLAAGLNEYSYALGLRRDLVGLESWDYGAPVFVGRHRVGVTDRLTLGGRLEASTDRVSGGGSVAVGLPFGQLELAGAASVGDAGPGAAASATFAYLGRRVGATGYARWVSDGYTTVSMSPADDRQVVEAGGSVSVPLVRGLTVSGQASAGVYRDRGPQDRLAILVNTRVARDLQLAVTGSRTDLSDSGTEYEAIATLTYSLGPRTTASFLGQVQGQSGAASAELQRMLPRGDGWGYRLVDQQGTDDDNHGMAYVEAQNQHGHVDASWTWLQGSGTATVGVSGGVVAIGGRVFLTRPVQQGFALLRVPGVAGARAYLDNQEIGRTDANGDVVITDLTPYVTSRVSVADSDIPLDRIVIAAERPVAAPYRGGVVVTLGADRAVLLRGQIAVLGSAKSAAYGEMSVAWADETASSPLGSNGEFELVNVPEGRHRAWVRFAGGLCRFHLHVPARQGETVVQLGALRCTMGAVAWR